MTLSFSNIPCLTFSARRGRLRMNLAKPKLNLNFFLLHERKHIAALSDLISPWH